MARRRRIRGAARRIMRPRTARCSPTSAATAERLRRLPAIDGTLAHPVHEPRGVRGRRRRTGGRAVGSRRRHPGAGRLRRRRPGRSCGLAAAVGRMVPCDSRHRTTPPPRCIGRVCQRRAADRRLRRRRPRRSDRLPAVERLLVHQVVELGLRRGVGRGLPVGPAGRCRWRTTTMATAAATSPSGGRPRGCGSCRDSSANLNSWRVYQWGLPGDVPLGPR